MQYRDNHNPYQGWKRKLLLMGDQQSFQHIEAVIPHVAHHHMSTSHISTLLWHHHLSVLLQNTTITTSLLTSEGG